MTYFFHNENETKSFGRKLAQYLKAGDIIFLHGPLGAGKTTFVRGALEGLGYLGAVRSPTFNLIQTFDTSPPVMHADLYRIENHRNLGLEDYLETHICFIEWPDRAVGLIADEWITNITFEFQDERRKVTLSGRALPCSND